MNYKKLRILAALLILSVSFYSCKKEYETIEQLDDSRIKSYIQSNSLTNMNKEPNGVYMQIVNIGSGGFVANADSVLFNVKVANLDGKVLFETPAFSNSGDYLGYLSNEFPTSLVPNVPYPSSVIRTAISKIQRGGSVKVIIPSHVAYGRAGNTLVSPNEVLVIDLSVYKEKNQAELDDSRIRQYLTSNNIAAVKDPSGAYYQVIQEGTTGLAAQLYTIVKTKYRAKLLDGYVFDQTIGETPYEVELASTRYYGLRKILVNRKAGTKLRVFMPSIGALGGFGTNDVPKNSVIDIELELQEVVDDTVVPAPTT